MLKDVRSLLSAIAAVAALLCCVTMSGQQKANIAGTEARPARMNPHVRLVGLGGSVGTADKTVVIANGVLVPTGSSSGGSAISRQQLSLTCSRTSNEGNPLGDCIETGVNLFVTATALQINAVYRATYKIDEWTNGHMLATLEKKPGGAGLAGAFCQRTVSNAEFPSARDLSVTVMDYPTHAKGCESILYTETDSYNLVSGHFLIETQ